MTVVTHGARRRLAPGGFGAATVVLALVTLSVFVLAMSPTLNPFSVLLGQGFTSVVPDVTGKTQTKALITLHDEHLSGKVRFAFSASVTRGLVIRQVPPAGDRLLRGSTAELVVSRGPARLILPDFAGEREKDAVDTVRAAGIGVDVERVNDENVRKGRVISQQPGEGVTVAGGERITLRVSLGPAIRSVPGVVNLPQEGALFLIGRAGLTVNAVLRVNDANVPAGSVVALQPPAGTEMPRDGAVTVTVSNGPTPVVVPQLVGGDETAAAAQLSSLGLVAAEIPQFNDVAVPPNPDGTPGAQPPVGRVLAQQPAAGTSLRPGEVVTLSVKRSLPATTTTLAPAAPVAPAAVPGQ